MFSVAILTRTDGALQPNQGKDKELTTSQKSVHPSLVREVQCENLSWGKGFVGLWCRGWAVWVTLARVREQRVKCCPNTGTSQTSSSLHRGFHSRLTDGHIPPAPHISSKAWTVFEKLWNPVPGLPMVGQAVLYKSLSKSKMRSELKISSFSYVIT